MEVHVAFVLSTRHSLTKLSNYSWSTSYAWRRVSTARGSAIGLVSSTSRIIWSNGFLNLPSRWPSTLRLSRKAAGTNADWSCCLCFVVCSPNQFHRGTVRWEWQTLILPLSIVVECWDSQSGPLNLRLFDGSIVLPVGLIDVDRGEWPVRHLDGEVPSSELLNYFRVCRRQFHCLADAHESAVVVGVVQRMEPYL